MAVAALCRPNPSMAQQWTAPPCAPAAAGSAKSQLSLVFTFDTDGQSDARDKARVARRSSELLEQLKERITHFSGPHNGFAAQLLRDARHLWRDVNPDAVALASELCSQGYDVVLRTAIGGGTACFKNLRHDFIQVRGDGDFEGMEFIVEPRFREQFEISHPSAEYLELLSVVPEIFVGSAARLVPVVQTICSEMQASFEQQGLTMPPWRRTQAMLSKWMPARVRDTAFSRASPSPACSSARDLPSPSPSAGRSPFAACSPEPFPSAGIHHNLQASMSTSRTLQPGQLSVAPPTFASSGVKTASDAATGAAWGSGAVSTAGSSPTAAGAMSPVRADSAEAEGKSPRVRSPQLRGLLSAQLAGEVTIPSPPLSRETSKTGHAFVSTSSSSAAVAPAVDASALPQQLHPTLLLLQQQQQKQQQQKQPLPAQKPAFASSSSSQATAAAQAAAASRQQQQQGAGSKVPLAAVAAAGAAAISALPRQTSLELALPVIHKVKPSAAAAPAVAPAAVAPLARQQ